MQKSSPVRTAVVTGAAQGIGRAIAARLIADGTQVVLFDLAHHVAETAAQIHAAGQRQLDVTDFAALREAIDGTARDLGRLDILVNCAGTCDRGSFEELTPEIFRRDLDTNLTATAFGCQAAVFPHMREQGWGRLVNIASVSGKVGGIGPVNPSGSGGRSGPAYVAAKAGTINLTRWIAREVGAWGVTCNAVVPGPIASAMANGVDYGVESLPVPRMGRVDEVAEAVAYLVSADAGYTTGACLHVDGGAVMA